MQTVLYAIDHMRPDRQSLAYALTLCRQMMTRLDVLHILQTQPIHRHPLKHPLKRISSGILKARDAFENTMIKATFAEAGAPDYENVLKEAAYEAFQRVLPDTSDSRFDYHCIVTSESPDTIIQQYVHDHRKVVLAVFDTPHMSSQSKKTGCVSSQHMNFPKLPIPLVTVKDIRNKIKKGDESK